MTIADSGLGVQRLPLVGQRTRAFDIISAALWYPAGALFIEMTYSYCFWHWCNHEGLDVADVANLAPRILYQLGKLEK